MSYYNNQNLYITATGESIYTYIDDLVQSTSNSLIIYTNTTSNSLISYTSTTSNNLIKYINSNLLQNSNIFSGIVNNIQYNYKQTINDGNKNALIVGDKLIEFKSNNKIETRINDKGYLEFLVKYEPQSGDDIRYILLAGKYPNGTWRTLRGMLLDQVLEEVQHDIKNFGNAVITATEAGTFLTGVGDTLVLVGGAVGVTLTGLLVAKGIDLVSASNPNSSNSEKMLYNLLLEAMITEINNSSNNIRLTSNYAVTTSNLLAGQIRSTSNLLASHLNTTSNNLGIYINTTSNSLATNINTTSSAIYSHINELWIRDTVVPSTIYNDTKNIAIGTNILPQNTRLNVLGNVLFQDELRVRQKVGIG